MGISSRRSVVHNRGNINKGGTKTIYSYGKDGLSSIRTVRGSVNNKSGGADNNYYIRTERPDRPSKIKSSSRPSSKSSANYDAAGGGALLGILFILFLGVFWLIWKGGVWLYEKTTHKTV